MTNLILTILLWFGIGPGPVEKALTDQPTACVEQVMSPSERGDEASGPWP